MSCLEVCASCTDNIVSHLQACLVKSSAVALVTVITEKVSTLRELRAAVDAELSLAGVRDRVRFQPAGDYLKELFGV